MNRAPITPEVRYAKLVKALVTNPKVSQPKEKSGFGSSALWISGKMFAVLSSNGQLVIKLPKQRVDDLVATGNGERFDPGHGRKMKEWLSLQSKSELEWLLLAREAMEFVASRC